MRKSESRPLGCGLPGLPGPGLHPCSAFLGLLNALGGLKPQICVLSLSRGREPNSSCSRATGAPSEALGGLLPASPGPWGPWELLGCGRVPPNLCLHLHMDLFPLRVSLRAPVMDLGTPCPPTATRLLQYALILRLLITSAKSGSVFQIRSHSQVPETRTRTYLFGVPPFNPLQFSYHPRRRVIGKEQLWLREKEVWPDLEIPCWLEEEHPHPGLGECVCGSALNCVSLNPHMGVLAPT